LLQAVFEFWGRASLAALETILTAHRPLATYLDSVRAGMVETTPAGLQQSLAWIQIATRDPVLRRWHAEHIERLLAALAEDSRELAELGSRPGGQSIERVPPLFPKIEPPS
jgi:hypothetical protein